MRRDEFWDSICYWSDLFDFCDDNRCRLLENVVDDYYRNETIEERLADWAHDYTWENLRQKLNEIYDEGGHDYYEWDDYYASGFRPLDDDDFESFKQDVYDWMDENGEWDDDDDEDEDDEDYDDDPVVYAPVEEEACSIMDMFSESVVIASSKNEDKADFEVLFA